MLFKIFESLFVKIGYERWKLKRFIFNPDSFKVCQLWIHISRSTDDLENICQNSTLQQTLTNNIFFDKKANSLPLFSKSIPEKVINVDGLDLADFL